MKRLALTIVPALLLALAGRWLVKACAQPVVFPVFVYSRHPDLPRSEFIDGRMGVLQPTFARSYLVIAYRYLNGVGLNEREREQARDFYKDRETGDWDHTGTDWSDYWRRTRSTVKAVPLPPSLSVTLGKLAYSPENHNFDLNCAEDAFRVAAHTLEARRQRFGLTNPASCPGYKRRTRFSRTVIRMARFRRKRRLNFRKSCATIAAIRLPQATSMLARMRRP